MYNQPYEEILAEYKAGNSVKRQIAKPAVLGCGYGLSGGERRINAAGDEIRTGLWGYAENMGVKMTQDEAHTAVKVFRDSYPEVVRCWHGLEEAAVEAINSGDDIQYNDVVFDTCIRKGGQKIMRILLPSGRHLHYFNVRMQVRDENSRKKSIVYDGIGHGAGATQKGATWGPVFTYGGKLAENIVQAISRDVLVNGMFLADEAALTIIGHCHDEIICLESEDNEKALQTLLDCMKQPPSWAKDLPLGAEGYCEKVYRK
jgi:DNA polymerase